MNFGYTIMVSKKFTRKIENFTCRHCGKIVKGDGYTNHCPFCLWSAHVDINPGDRQSACLGMMKPAGIAKGKRGWIIIHQCLKCGFQKRNKTDAGDNFDEIIRLQKP
jgi:hypothetical protein